MDKSLRLCFIVSLICFSVEGQVTLNNGSIQNAQLGQLAPSGGSGGGSPLVTAQTPGSSRTDAITGVGLTFIAQSTVTITSLGRWVYSGNSGTHTVSLKNAAGAVLTSSSVNTAGATANAFKNVACTPYTLTIGVRYFVLSAESGGDQWGEENSVTCDSTVTGGGGTAWNSAFQTSGSPTANSALKSYVPVQALWTP